MSVTRVLVAAAALALTGCASATPQIEISGGSSASGGSPTMGLAELAEACADAVDDTGTAVVDLPGDLRDANVTVELVAPCLIRLAPTSDVTLNQVTIMGEALEVDDVDAEPGMNRIRLQGVTIETTSLVVTLSDADDRLQVERSTISGEQGVVVHVAGVRNDANAGGDIRFVNSEVVAGDPAGAGVTIGASEHDGRFRATNLIIESDSHVLVSAGDCRVARSGSGPVDCSTDALVEDLERQRGQGSAG